MNHDFQSEGNGFRCNKCGYLIRPDSSGELRTPIDSQHRPAKKLILLGKQNPTKADAEAAAKTWNIACRKLGD
jgi:hypothetical protein